MENLKPEIIAAGLAALCIVVPALIVIGSRLGKKPTGYWTQDTIDGLKEGGWKPGQIKKFLKRNNIKPLKK